MRKIELLSPAKDKLCGIEAINHGADAVYIGAPLFSARAAAGNSVQDIEELARYAHQYDAKVYVALNTILKEEELPIAQKLINELYIAGSDALIVQDMGLLQLDLPSIALHASTQMDNRTLEKVSFLEKVGFSQVVLARELSLQQISTIAKGTSVALECFVHGALCVSYSGQCYISQALSKRSANCGCCAQYCRLPYTLIDSEGAMICEDKHLLSLKDLNLSSYMEEMMEAGISSFKIEGRLKELSYVKNVTAYYRQVLDRIIEKRTFDYQKSSSGRVHFFFKPQIEKSFNRGFTTYFFRQREFDMVSFDTPKSLGECVGKVIKSQSNAVWIENKEHVFHNGDGFCFFDNQRRLCGFRANRVEQNKVILSGLLSISKGTILYRNLDQAFEQQLKKKTAERKIEISMFFCDVNDGYELTIQDSLDSVCCFFKTEKEIAKKCQEEQIKQWLGKLGDTIFVLNSVTVCFSTSFFIAASEVNRFRREAIAEFVLLKEKKRRDKCKSSFQINHPTYIQKEITYLGNVLNNEAEAFYRQCGVEKISPAYEAQPTKKVPIMFTKYCIRHALGLCKKKQIRSEWKDPFFLLYKEKKLRLEFDCNQCEMRIFDDAD